MAGRRRRRGLTAALLVAAAAAPAWAQETSAPPWQLPRRGYEPRALRVGAATVATEVAAQLRYDDNIFATSTAAVDDTIFIVAPRVTLDAGGPRAGLRGELFADIREYLDNSGESRAGFGVALSGDAEPDQRQRVSGGARYERLVESRNDPEADDRLGLPPRTIDLVAGDVGYRLQGARFGLQARLEAASYDYRPPEDADRSLVSLRGALRGSLRAASGVALFVEGYANRRDHDRALDRNGVDRDATTLGLLAGARLEASRRWTGEVGVGVFRADPDDQGLRRFSGVGASANLVWSPVPRTAVTLQGFRGDVATVRAGAIGRVDTRIGVRIDQEARHNLLLAAAAGYRETRFRGVAEEQRTVAAEARAELLLNRALSLFADASWTRRSADRPLDRFERAYAGFGLRFRG